MLPGTSQLSCFFLLSLTKKILCYVQSKGKIVKTLSCKAIASVFIAPRSCVVKDKSFNRNLNNRETVSLSELAILFLSFIIFHVDSEEKREIDKRSPTMN